MYFALDIGGTRIKSAVIEKTGAIVEKFKPVPTPANIKALHQQLGQLIIEALEKHDIKGIPLSCAGINNPETREMVHWGSKPFVDGHNLPLHIENRFAIPSSIINDGHAATLGEKWLGELKGVEQGALITLGTGVGCGLIINGEIYRGAHFFAGELSFIYTDDSLPSMGNQASSVNFIREAQAYVTPLQPDRPASGEEVCAAIKQGDNAQLNDLFQYYCEVVGRLIYNVQMVLDYEVVAIGGAISAEPLVIDGIRQQYERICDRYMSRLEAFKPVRITACKLQNDANLAGAVNYFLTKRY